jgi:excisionase family DNA binding protein
LYDYLYTVDELSKILKISKNNVYELINSKVLIGLKLGRLKVTKFELIRFLKENNGKDLSDLNDIKDLII